MPTRSLDLVLQSLELAADGLSTSEVARRVGVPRSTVQDWLAGRVPAGYGRGGPRAPRGGLHDLDALPASYVHLLGMYLGDGCLSAHPRGVFKLRISLDARYPGIAEECERARLTDWQRRLVARWPALLLRGLIHSDGCRFQNTGRCGWSHPRYVSRKADVAVLDRFVGPKT